MKKTRILLTAAALALCAAAGHAAGLKVPDGYRAAAVPADRAELRLIKPGDRLDMTVTFSALMKDGRKETLTATILQNVLVLDVVDKGGVRAVVLALNPNEAQYAMLSLSDGYRVHFTLRGPKDVAMYPMEMAGFSKLFGASAERPAAGEAEAR